MKRFGFIELIIGMALGIILYHHFAPFVSCPPCQEIVKTEVVYDSVPVVVTSEVPVPYRVEKHTTSGIKNRQLSNGNFDTFENKPTPTFENSGVTPFENCSDVAHYSDTFTDDSSYLIRLNETVSQNRITGRELVFQNLRPTTITHYSPPSKWSLYAGVYYSRSLGIAASLNYKKLQYDLGYGADKKLLAGVKYRIY